MERKHSSQKRKSASKPIQCFNCGKYNHKNFDCKFEPRTCQKCSVVGHIEGFCRQRKIHNRSKYEARHRSGKRKKLHKIIYEDLVKINFILYKIVLIF